MARSAAVIAIAVSCAATMVAPALAKPGNDKGQGHGNAAPAIPGGSFVFSGTERQLISNYFLRNGGYYSELPPGIRRQLVTKGRLPPGIAKKALPPGLAGGLPSVPSGFERMIVGPDVLLVEIATGIIFDIIRDVVR